MLSVTCNSNNLQVSEQKVPQLQEVIDFFPETNKIIQITDSFFNILHQDSRLEEFSLFFESNIFKSFSKENAHVIFSIYKEVACQYLLENNSELIECSKQLKDRISPHYENSLINHEVKNVIDKVITRLHRGLPALAISKALKVGIAEIDILKPLSIEEQDFLQNLKIDKSLFALFERKV